MDNAITNGKNLGNNYNNLEKYCVYLMPQSKPKTQSINILGDLIYSYFDKEKFMYKKPSLGYHITLFTFLADPKNEDVMFERISKNRYNIGFSIDSTIILGDREEVLALKVNSEVVKNNHWFIVSELMDYAMLSVGVSARVDKSLFRFENPYILNSYNSHITVAEKNKGKFDKKILKNFNKLIDSSVTYDSSLMVSKKIGPSQWEEINIEQGPSY